MGDGRDPTVAARFLLDKLLLARCVQRQMHLVDVLCSSSTVVYVPLIMRDTEVPQIQVIANLVDIPARNRDRCSTFNSGLMAAMTGFSTHFASFFALLRYSGVERQFFELSSAHSCECSSAPVGLPIHPEVLWTYTLAHMSLNNNNNNKGFCSGVDSFDPLERPKQATMAVACDEADGGASSARRRREHRLRAFWMHETFAVQCAIATATHHSAFKPRRSCDSTRG